MHVFSLYYLSPHAGTIVGTVIQIANSFTLGFMSLLFMCKIILKVISSAILPVRKYIVWEKRYMRRTVRTFLNNSIVGHADRRLDT